MSLYWQLPVGKTLGPKETQSLSREFNRKKVKRKILKKKVRYEPPRQKKQNIHHQYKSSKARDSRYSDQQKLRRMYRSTWLLKHHLVPLTGQTANSIDESHVTVGLGEIPPLTAVFGTYVFWKKAQVIGVLNDIFNPVFGIF